MTKFYVPLTLVILSVDVVTLKNHAMIRMYALKIGVIIRKDVLMNVLHVMMDYFVQLIHEIILLKQKDLNVPFPPVMKLLLNAWKRQRLFVMMG
jgi:hypothetical protein